MKNKIETFEQAAELLGIDPNILPIGIGINSDEIPTEFQASVIADYKLKVIAKALNEGWKADFDDTNKEKFTPWFEFQGGRFVLGGVACYTSYLRLGSRLCFRSWELAEYAAKQFKDLYRDLLVY